MATQIIPVDVARGNPVYTYLARYAAGNGNTRRAFHAALREAVAVMTGSETQAIAADQVFFFPWHQLDRQAVTMLLSMAKEKHAPSTANRIKCVVKAVQEESCCTVPPLLTWDTFHSIWHRQVKIPNRHEKAGRFVTDGEVDALFRACAQDPGPAGVRDAAMLAWGFTEGPRVSEVAAAQLADFEPASGCLKIVSGKGDKPRTNYLSNGALEAMTDWLELRADVPGPLFLAIDRFGRVQTGGLSTTAIQGILAKRYEQASVKAFSWHSLRRTFISNALPLMDVGAVMGIVGHSSASTTAGYDRRPELAKQQATTRLHVPYRGRTLQEAA